VRRLGLRFGGIDLLVDADGRHWFCELNPNGEWGWLQAAGLPIADAVALELAG
jgi:D-alanine-D-alanine ligase-like ATP-grasp enzyme